MSVNWYYLNNINYINNLFRGDGGEEARGQVVPWSCSFFTTNLNLKNRGVLLLSHIDMYHAHILKQKL